MRRLRWRSPPAQPRGTDRMKAPFRGAEGPVVVALCILLVGACAPKATPPDYSLFIEENPRSILVVPVLNSSPEVGAADYFLATVTVPLAERGYYVFPVNLVKELLADAGLADAGLVHTTDTVRLGKLFGADAVLYVTIMNWEAQYVVLTTTVIVGFEYELRSAKSGETLWKTAETMRYDPDVSSGGGLADLIVDVVEAAVTKAKPNYVPLARQANWMAICAKNVGPGRPEIKCFPMLIGPYHPSYGADRVAAPAKAAAPSKPVTGAEGIETAP